MLSSLVPLHVAYDDNGAVSGIVDMGVNHARLPQTCFVSSRRQAVFHVLYPLRFIARITLHLHYRPLLRHGWKRTWQYTLTRAHMLF